MRGCLLFNIFSLSILLIFPLSFSVDPLFSNDKQNIDVEWMRKVFPDKDTDEDLADWVQKLQLQHVKNVGVLKEQSKEDLERCGIPISIVNKLHNRCHPKS